MKKEFFRQEGNRKVRATSANWVAPTKEQATTGRFMSAGDMHGSGYRTPVGTTKEASMIKEGPIPHGKIMFSAEDIC